MSPEKLLLFLLLLFLAKETKEDSILGVTHVAALNTYSVMGILVLTTVGVASGASAGSMTWSPRHVDTRLGVVQGFIKYPGGSESGSFDGVEVIYNLPYASPPLGNLRFMPPVSASPWTGLRRSQAPSPVCPQVVPDIRNETETLKVMPRGKFTYLRRLLPHLRNQSEDCLYLNVYAPLKVAEGKTQEKVPVLVFIHGEDWSYGSGNPYDPSMLVSYGNIIVVTLNYRLGILGFLNANSDSHFRLPYNFAMLDQIAGLQWIQENIALFGGDRFNVTLMGHGKGTVLVNFLMVSSAVPTGLLFHRVILCSGSALSPLLSSDQLSTGPELTKKFATRVRCPPEPSSTMLECLREVPVRQFLESELWSLFGPTGDGIVIKSETPSDTVVINKGSHYPMLFGVVKAEALLSLSDHDAIYGMENERRRELLRDFINKYFRWHRNEILAGAIHEYTDWEKPVQHPLNVRDETLEALADAQVVAPMIKAGDLHSQSSRSRAYFYVFEYQSKSSDYQQRLGCVHGEELPYIFGVPVYFHFHQKMMTMGPPSPPDISETSLLPLPDLFTPTNFSSSEVQLSLTVMRLWTNFVRFGNPNGDPKHLRLSPRSNHHHYYHYDSLSLPSSSEKVSSSSSFSSGSGSGPNHRSSSSRGGGSVQTVKEEEKDRSGHSNHDHQTVVGASSSSGTLPEPIVVEWPLYEALDKKYMLLDLRPRIKSHYRAHKLSFWLHLVPDYQNNDEGTDRTSVHHGYTKNLTETEVGNNSLVESPKLSPSLPRGGRIPGGIDHNNIKEQQDSSGSVGENHISTRAKEKKRKESSSSAAVSLDENEREEDVPSSSFSSFFVSGFQSYSTALSVTIAIGVSLFILNILIFATFYYEREKRLDALRRRQNQNQVSFSSSSVGAGALQMTSSAPRHQIQILEHEDEEREHQLHETISRTSTLKRRKQESSILYQQQQPQYHHHRGSIVFDDDLHEERESQIAPGSSGGASASIPCSSCGTVKRYPRRTINEVMSMEREEFSEMPTFVRISESRGGGVTATSSSSFGIRRNIHLLEGGGGGSNNTSSFEDGQSSLSVYGSVQ